MSKQLIILLLFLTFLIIATSYYYYWTVPANSIWYDQRAAIEVFQKIIDGQFPSVGYNNSIGIPTFPAFYYLTTTAYYFLSDPIQLFYFTALINVISILILTVFLYFRLSALSAIIFGIYSVTNVWGLYYGSFLWNPNFIPFSMTLLYLSLYAYLKEKKVLYFHISGVLINIIVQMSPQAIVLVPSFALSLFLLKKVPNLLNQIFHVLIHFVLVFPWIYHTRIAFPNSSEPTHSTLFKNFLTPLLEYTNYLGGWGLTQEWGKYLDYGTVYSKENIFWNPLLQISTIVLFCLVIWTSITIFKERYEQKDLNQWQEILLFLAIINLSTFFYVILGMWMAAHHYQYLSPTIALLLAIGLNFQKKYSKIIIILISFVIFSQGFYSYWRAYSESIRPYITDIGYQEIFSDYVKKECPNTAKIRYVNPNGIHTYMRYGDLTNMVSNCNWMLVQKNHYDYSTITQDLLNEKFQLSQNQFKDYLIWYPK
ncbi:MAG: hypothetical protein VXA48_04910 [Deltaproteobacteria bacterium]